MHNAAYHQMGFPGVYLRFDVPGDYASFERFVDWLRCFPDALGVSVTIPHKSNAIQYVNNNKGKLDGLAEHIGAVNTLKFYPDGTAAGINSDHLGFITALVEGAGLLLEKLEGKRVAVLGAGGVSRAIVAAMKKYGANIIIYNRTAKRAAELAKDFKCDCRPWDERNQLEADIVINGTSIGMWPNDDESPLDASAIKPGMIVFDTVYNPLETKLLRLAGDAKAKTVDGLSMLVYQAYEQIEFWTDNKFNVHDCIQTMRNVALESLKNKKA
jgi:3-dehydroquinate dehydratase/shikimate dehydrogenase